MTNECAQDTQLLSGSVTQPGRSEGVGSLASSQAEGQGNSQEEREFAKGLEISWATDHPVRQRHREKWCKHTAPRSQRFTVES